MPTGRRKAAFVLPALTVSTMKAIMLPQIITDLQSIFK